MFALRAAAASAFASVSLLLLLSACSPATTVAFEASPKIVSADLASGADRLFGLPSENYSSRAVRSNTGVGVGMSTGASTGASLASTAENYAAGDAASPVRILGLHGKGGTGPDFGERLGPLVGALSDRLGGRRVILDCPTAPFDLGGGAGEEMAWWTLPPGVRSFNAKEYLGFEESASVVIDALGGTDEGYDFVLGHSQGAILLSALLARGNIPTGDVGDVEGRSRGRKNPRGYILNGAAWPNPFSSRLSSFQWDEGGKRYGGGDDEAPPPRCLFVIGSSDGINPPEGARRVREALSDAGLVVDTIDHAGGHSVPIRNEEALARLVGWMANALER